MPGFKSRYPQDNTFSTSEKPVGDYERAQMVKHIAESMVNQGLTPEGPAAIYAEAQKHLEFVQSIGQGLPQADHVVWKQYGRSFGKYKILVCCWEKISRVHLLHLLGNTTIHYRRYWNRGKWWFVQLDLALEPVKDTKMDEYEFFVKLKRMTRSPYPKQVASVEAAVEKYVRDLLSNDNTLE